MHRQFGLLNRLDLRRQMNELRRTYDWPTLRRVILGSPRDNSKAISMQDLFNLLDLHIQSNSGFRVPGSNNKIESTFIRPEDFVPARRALQLLIILQFYIWFRRLLLEKSDLLKPYRHFAESLARLMEEEGFELANRGAELKNRSYYLFGYSVVSMNWDPLLLWLVFNAHKMANHHWPESKVGRPARPQKLFNDLAYMVAVRQVDGGDLDIWYMMSEAAAQRLNDSAHLGDRYVRTGKLYFPHGSFNLRECPNCGKINAYLGDEWKLLSEKSLTAAAVPELV